MINLSKYISGIFIKIIRFRIILNLLFCAVTFSNISSGYEIDNFSRIRKINNFNFLNFSHTDFNPYAEQRKEEKYTSQWEYEGNIIYKGFFAKNLEQELKKIADLKENNNFDERSEKLLEKNIKNKLKEQLKIYCFQINDQTVDDTVEKLYQNELKVNKDNINYNVSLLEFLSKIQIDNIEYLNKAKIESQEIKQEHFKSNYQENARDIRDDNIEKYQNELSKRDNGFGYDSNLIEELEKKVFYSKREFLLRKIDLLQTESSFVRNKNDEMILLDKEYEKLDCISKLYKLSAEEYRKNNEVDKSEFSEFIGAKMDLLSTQIKLKKEDIVNQDRDSINHLRQSISDLKNKVKDLSLIVSNNIVKKIYPNNHNSLPRSYMNPLINLTTNLFLMLQEETSNSYFTTIGNIGDNDINLMLNTSKSSDYLLYRKSNFAESALIKLISELDNNQSADSKQNIECANKIFPMLIDVNIDEKTDAETLPLVQMPDNVLADSVMMAINDLDRVIFDRMMGNKNLEHVSSGDQDFYTGAWARLDLSKVIQKTSEIKLGYKANIFTATVGYDYCCNDYLFGLAYSNSDIKSKHKLNISEYSNMHTARAYTQIYILDNLYINFDGLWGRGNITKKRYSLNNATNYVTAKTTSNVMGGRITIGYNIYPMEYIYITPNISTNHRILNIQRYDEKQDNNIQNVLLRSVKSKKHSETAVSFGINTGISFIVSNLRLTPELCFNIQNIIKQKHDNTVISISKDLPLITVPSKKVDKIHYQFGSSIKLDNADELCGSLYLGYNFTKTKSTQAQNFYIKLKVNL